MMRASRALCFGASLLCALAALVSPAHADLEDKFFSALESYAGVSPDTIEMARYSIRSPGNGAIVFQHAGAQDYPFFAIVGAVKAAKNRNIPKIGIFTQGKCLAPITAIDEIFGGANGYIDDLAGQAKTTGVVNQAKQYAVQYAQQQTEEAKAQVVAELTENVPYFGELPVICDFAFNTDFQAERNLQTLVSESVRAIRDAYNAFKDGDIGYGVDRLIDVGFDSSTVCKIADEIVSGGLIGSTPILGDIVNGACKGFVGSIIKGVGKAVYNEGKKIVEGAACAVESLWGGCDDDSPPPPSGIGNAQAFCQPYGGIKGALSKTNAPDDFSVVCNDGSACVVKPGETPKCSTGAQIAAHKAELKKKAAEDLALDLQNLAMWKTQFVDVWGGECEDDPCRAAMPPLRDQGFANANNLLANAGDFDEPWSTVHFLMLKPVEQKAAAEIEASKQRTAELNKQITANASQGWEEIAVGIWSKQCYDEQCKNEVSAIGKAMAAAAVALQDASPDESSLHVQGEIGKEYGPKFKDAIDASYNRHVTAGASQGWAQIAIGIWTKQCWDQQCKDEIVDLANHMAADAVAMQAASPDESSLHVQGVVGKTYGPKFKAAVDASNKRKILADPNAIAEQKLPVLGCNHFLGRAKEWLCPATGDGFASCVKYVNQAAAIYCLSPANLAYGTKAKVIAALKGQACTQIGVSLAFSCPTANAQTLCQRFVNAGMAVNCNAVSAIAILPPAKPTLMLPKVVPTLRTPQQDLASIGCQQFGPNPQDWICPDARTFATCVAYVRANNQIAACLERDNQALYSTDRRAIAFLGPQGCQNDGSNPLSFACSTPQALAVCQEFVIGGMPVVCKPPLVQIRPLTLPALRLAPTP